MSLIIFFGFSVVFFVVSTIYIGLVIRHHWLKSRQLKADSKN